MADHATIARPYARAAFDVASAAGALGPWLDALNIAAAAVTDGTVQSLLDDPSRTPDGQAELLLSVYAERPADEACNFLRLLAANERLDALPDVAAQFADMKAAAEHTLEVEVVSVEPIDDAASAALSSALRTRLGRDVQLRNTLDPEILGGVVVKAGDLVIDGSARARLDRLASALRA
ncbi:MAG: F0F1 ATP synthase subunit delta [Pseudomonadota bacterium]